MDFSPALDAGSNSAVPGDEFDLDGDGDFVEPLPIDLDANNRFVDVLVVPDSGEGVPPIVDMGAYEHQSGGEPIPMVSEWSFIVMLVLMVTAGTPVYARRRAPFA